MVEREQFKLERILLEKQKELSRKKEIEYYNNLKELREIYYKLKDIVYGKYYPEIEKLFPWYTDHGKKHVESIIHAMGDLLIHSYGRLNEMEIFILLCATIFHDTGMTISRDEHADNVKEIIQNMRFLITDITVSRRINEIARAHSSKSDLDQLNLIDSCTFNDINYDIQTKALAAMLRLADDISETRYRIDPDLLSKVPEENIIFWHYANAVESVVISATDMNCKITICIPKSILLKEFKYDSGTKIFFEYVLERIEKSYKERVLCSLEFRNIVVISAFKIEMNIMSDDMYDKIKGITFEINENYFQTMSLKDVFYEKNPEWTIDALKNQYL